MAESVAAGELQAGLPDTIEGFLKKRKLLRYASSRGRCGVRRVSLGIQSFAPRVLRTLGREHDPEQAARGLARAVFSKLSEALPKPFRLMRELGRTVGRFVPRGE